jgi:hypothetical protein
MLFLNARDFDNNVIFIRLEFMSMRVFQLYWFTDTRWILCETNIQVYIYFSIILQKILNHSYVTLFCLCFFYINIKKGMIHKHYPIKPFEPIPIKTDQCTGVFYLYIVHNSTNYNFKI